MGIVRYILGDILLKGKDASGNMVPVRTDASGVIQVYDNAVVGSNVTIRDEGIAQGTASVLDFVGAGVSASVGASIATITVTTGTGGSLTVKDEGTTQGTASTLDFTGGGVSASVAGGIATISVATGWSGGQIDSPVIVDVTDAEAFLVRRDADSADVFAVATSGSLTSISGGLLVRLNNDQNVHIDGRSDPRQITLGVMRFEHTPGMDGTRCITMDVDNAGFADTRGLTIDHHLAGMVAGETVSAVALNVDPSTATGGHCAGFQVTTTASGTVPVDALVAREGVSPVHHWSGQYVAVEQAWKYDGGYTDVTAAFGSTGTDVALFNADNDYVYVGMAAKFNSLEVILAVASSNPGVKPAFAYSIGGGSWTALVPADGTNGFRQNGTVAWGSPAGWATDTVNGVGSKYWIRIQRTANNLSTLPTEDTVRVAVSTAYYWNLNGDIACRSISPTIAMAHTGLSGLLLDDHTQYQTGFAAASGLYNSGTSRSPVVAVSGNLSANGRVYAQVGTSGSVGPRRTLQFLASSGMMISGSDDPTGEKVTLSFESSGGGGGFGSDGYWGASNLHLSVVGVSGIAAQASVSGIVRAPVIGSAYRYNNVSAYTYASGAAGARYVFADVSELAPAFSLSSSGADAPSAQQKKVGVAYWNGAAITHVFTVGKSSEDYAVTFVTQRTTTSTTYVDTGDSTTFVSDGVTPQAISALGLLGQNAATGRAYMGVVVDSTTEFELQYMDPAAIDGDATQFVVVNKLFAAGSHVMKLQLKQANAGTAMINAHVVPTRLAVRQLGGG